MLLTVTKLSQPFIHKFANELPLESIIYHFHNHCLTQLNRYNPRFIVRVRYEFPNYYTNKFTNIDCAHMLKNMLETKLNMKYNNYPNELLSDYTLDINNFIFFKSSMADYTCNYNDNSVTGLLLKVSTS